MLNAPDYLPAPRAESLHGRRERAARSSTEQAAARQVTDETRLTALQADGALHLGGHIMEGVANLDLHRRHLAKDDVTANMLLAEIEAETIQQVKNIQRSLFNRWDI